MEITYIHHSGFLIEWTESYWLFDYYKGDLPEFDRNKKLFIFASHQHSDHFNPDIFQLKEKCHDVEYVLSSDIKRTKIFSRNSGAPDELSDKVVFVKPSEQYELEDGRGNAILLKTLKSTDCGVAFLLQYQGKTIYHAGDLNLWVWKSESKEYNENMTSKFNKEMNALKDVLIDVAFVPLDPRQEEWYCLGLEQLLRTARIRYVFPMHFWNNPYIIKQFKQEKSADVKQTAVIDISRDGQRWNLEI